MMVTDAHSGSRETPCFSCGGNSAGGMAVFCLDTNCTSPNSSSNRWHLLCGPCVLKCDAARITKRETFTSNIRTNFEACSVSSCPTPEYFTARRIMS